MTADEQSFVTALAQLNRDCPRLARGLRQAEEQRSWHITALTGGVRVKGLEALLNFLDGIAEAFRAEPSLARLTFLVERCVGDFETAVEATLSGYLSVAADAMRDVMEVEHLMLDFAIHPGHIDQWFTFDEQARWSKFRPAKIRGRLHAAGVAPYQQDKESVDYAAHSQALHVNPGHRPLGDRGRVLDRSLTSDAGFWEIFEHARRLHRALRRLTEALAPCSDAHGLVLLEPEVIEDAWQRTQQLQGLFLALLQASSERLQSGPEPA